MRIIYAAGNTHNSVLQLQKYLHLFKQSKHQFKIAAYSNACQNYNVDFCLDALLNFTKKQVGISFNGNFSYYCKKLLEYKPELIISDFEPYTSIFAIEKNIPLWQVSPILLYYALPDRVKKTINLHKHYSHLISGNVAYQNHTKNILNNSNKKLVLSCLCDIKNRPQLNNSFDWCRPELQLTNSLENTIIGYGNNLFDAFYNHKYCKIHYDQQDIESVISSYAHNYYKLGTFTQGKEEIDIQLDQNVKFLMELL